MKAEREDQAWNLQWSLVSNTTVFFHDKKSVSILAHTYNKRNCKIFSTGEFGFI